MLGCIVVDTPAGCIIVCSQEICSFDMAPEMTGQLENGIHQTLVGPVKDNSTANATWLAAISEIAAKGQFLDLKCYLTDLHNSHFPLHWPTVKMAKNLTGWNRPVSQPSVVVIVFNATFVPFCKQLIDECDTIEWFYHIARSSKRSKRLLLLQILLPNYSWMDKMAIRNRLADSWAGWLVLALINIHDAHLR